MSFWQQIGAGTVGTLILVVLSLAQLAQIWILKKKTELQTEAASLAAWQAHQAAQKAAANVAEVKRDLKVTDSARAQQLEQIEVTGKATHVLVNNKFSVVLRALADALRAKADMSGLATDIQAADIAARDLDDHLVKQRVVDREQNRNVDEGKPTA